MTKELKNRILENKVLTHDERMEIIKALEIVEEFERAQIIIGGRLNGRTYAYKCGLEDGKRKALEQQTINCNATTEEIAQSFKADIEAVKDYLPKCNSMEFPKTFDEFASDYGFTDDKEIYTNGSHLIPVFRVKQWLDHIEQQPTSEDCVSRADLLKIYEDRFIELQKAHRKDTQYGVNWCINTLKDMPPVTHTQRWIPVSERLPKDRDWYLGIFKEKDTGWINTLPFVCDYVGKETKATTKEFWILHGFTDMDNPCDYYNNLECVAWQPLPTPYEEK